jgi:hypothetical protein
MAKMVGLRGFEPLTSPLSGVRSNQLSYRPVPSSAGLEGRGRRRASSGVIPDQGFASEASQVNPVDERT